MIQTLGLTALLSTGVAVGIVVLHSPWADDEIGVLPPLSATPDFDLAPQPEPQLPTKSVLVRVDAPEGGCWSATIPNEVPRNGCGPQTFPFEVEGFVLMHFERQVPGDWHFRVAIEADGRVVQTVGPTTTEYPSLDIGYRVPEETP